MERINRYKNSLANGVSFIVLTAAYQLRLGELILFETPNANILAAAALFGLANFITRSIANLALRCGAIRNWVLGPLNVSGYWLVDTSPVDSKDKSILIEPALLDMRFDSHTGEFKVDAYRYIDGQEFITKSKFASVKYDGHTRLRTH